MAVIIAAIITIFGGLGAGYLGARIGADTSIKVSRDSADAARELQDQQLAADRDREAREKKGAVYGDFLKNANAFYFASLELYDAQQQARRGGNSPALAMVVSRWMTARFNYQGSINNVFVYGSDEAWALANAIVDPVSQRATTTVPVVQRDQVELSKERFDDGYREFQKQLCREVPARPRSCVS